VSKLYSIHCVPTTRPLHSLPTRRSSDLDPRPDGGADLDELHRDLDPQQVHQGVVTVTKPPTANLRYAQRTQPATSSSPAPAVIRSEEHTSELQSRFDLVCRLLLEKQNDD